MKSHDHPPLYILRHGQTEWNRAGRMQGQLDSALTAIGRDQAERQGRILAALGLPDDTMFRTSPLGRARATASIALRALAGAVAEDDRLREVSVGRCEGLTHAEIDMRFPGLIDRERPFEWYFNCPGGESMATLGARVAAFLDSLDRPTVIVTHGITSRFLRARILGCDWRSLGSADGGQGVVYELVRGMQFRHAGD